MAAVKMIGQLTHHDINCGPDGNSSGPLSSTFCFCSAGVVLAFFSNQQTFDSVANANTSINNVITDGVQYIDDTITVMDIVGPSCDCHVLSCDWCICHMTGYNCLVTHVTVMWMSCDCHVMDTTVLWLVQLSCDYRSWSRLCVSWPGVKVWLLRWLMKQDVSCTLCYLARSYFGSTEPYRGVHKSWSEQETNKKNICTDVGEKSVEMSYSLPGRLYMAQVVH